MPKSSSCARRKLIWAGIRYIATATSSLLRLKNLTRPIEAIKDFSSEFRMVSNCHKERRLLLENNPHLTNWVPIAVPIDQWFSWPPPFDHPLFSIAPIVLPAVFKFYDGMSGFTCPPSHIMGKSRADRKFPQLATEDAKYYSVFYEGAHNDARTATYLALTAAEHGACVTNYTEMVDVIYEDKGNGEKGKAIGVKVKDRMSGNEFDVYAKSIVFAGGPFTDSLRKIEDQNSKPAVAAAAGTHIVLPGYYCSRGVGMLDINTSDGRFLFFLPWQGKTLVGTTDRKGPAESSPGPPEEEIQWLLNECQKYLASSGKGGEGLMVRR
jgi:glycerol-3-phosphate dehydrogenase